MDRNATSLQRQRIPNEKRKECLKLFEQGYGYKKTAQLAGLNTHIQSGNTSGGLLREIIPGQKGEAIRQPL